MLLAEQDRLRHLLETSPGMTVLGIQDTTDLDYTGNRVSSKLGSLNYENRKGYYAHNHLLTDIQGVSLGLFEQKLWNRNPEYFGANRTMWSLEDKESYRWLESFERFQSFFACFPQHTAIEVCDREADFYELFEARKAKNVHLVVRSNKDKTLADNKKLRATLEEQPVSDFYLTKIYDAKGKKHEAAFQVKFTPITIMPNYRATRDQPDRSEPVQLYAIDIEQVSPLFDGQNKPIIWRLLTTMTVTTFEQAFQVIEIYIRRWRIEEFHYTLKQGAKIQEIQLKEPQAIENAITFYSLLSCQIMNLRYGATQFPEKPIEDFGFSQKQFMIMVIFLSKKNRVDLDPKQPCTNIKQFAKMVKTLATTSKSKNPPGAKALWIGLSKLQLLIDAFDAFT